MLIRSVKNFLGFVCSNSTLVIASGKSRCVALRDFCSDKRKPIRLILQNIKFSLQIFKNLSFYFSRNPSWGASCQTWSATTTWSPAATSPPTKSPSCWPTTFGPSSPRFKRWSRKRRFRGKNFKNIPVFKCWKINMFIRENFHLCL